jgi:hypothetical protein
MKLTTLAVASAFALCCPLPGQSAGNSGGGNSKAGGPAATTYAQAGAPSGRGSQTGDPAASSATPRSDPTTTGRTMKSGPSGSGLSTSGGRDDNADQGRDKMPDSDKNVRPNNKPDKH